MGSATVTKERPATADVVSELRAGEVAERRAAVVTYRKSVLATGAVTTDDLRSAMKVLSKSADDFAADKNAAAKVAKARGELAAMRDPQAIKAEQADAGRAAKEHEEAARQAWQRARDCDNEMQARGFKTNDIDTLERAHPLLYGDLDEVARGTAPRRPEQDGWRPMPGHPGVFI